MNEQKLREFLAIERTYAATTFRLDEKIGTHHGLAWDDFVLLRRLVEAGEGDAGEVGEARLTAMLELRASRLLVRVRPLEKLGWVRRRVEVGDARRG